MSSITERNVLIVTEKCLDCWNYKKIYKVYRCVFGLSPVLVPIPDNPDKQAVACNCYAAINGEAAPARREFLRKQKR